ncbi:MAG: glycoside hydrolase family 2 TIM barrel-domain containing protein [Herbinix sp.]|nr:glycoside hydrolase family 2 TIM barrel-domain containing protein [Herbinix sp.]
MKIKDAIRTLLFKNKDIKYNQLYTVWGENIDPDKVLSEYPRPQLQRSNYTILNGYWKYNITKDSTVIKPAHYDGKILVPFSPESILSGVNRQLRPGELLWYERSLIIDRKPPKKRLILHFGAVDQTCEVLINKQRVAQHIGGYLPFSVDITDYVIEGGNLLTVKVMDSSDTSYHSRGKQKLKRGGMFYTAQSGIWQTVWMEWVPDIHITSLSITPIVNKSMIRLTINLNKSSLHADKKDTSLQGKKKNTRNIFRVDIYDHGTKIHSFISKNHTMDIPIKNITYWSPENPYLYDMFISTGDDIVQSYFAMRSVEIKQDENGIKRIYLNKEPYFQNGLLDQGYWSDGLYTPPSDEAMIFDIKQAKALGFNMLRKHIKIEPQRWYYHCDRLGMLVWQDMVNGGGKYNKLLVGYLPTLFPGVAGLISDRWHFLFGRNNAEGRKEWINECEETVGVLYNHPSIIVWVPFNEGWGQFDAGKITKLIRSVDDTRLIDEASGWYDQKGGDFKSVHNYFHPLKYTPDKRNRTVVLSEFGGYACYISEHSYSPMLYGYRVYANTTDLEAALQRLYQEDILKLKKEGVSAVVYTQLSDIEDEVNGLFTYDRKVCKISKQLM